MATAMSVDQIRLEGFLNVNEVLEVTETLHPTVQHTLQSALERMRNATSRGKVLDFAKSDFALVAHNDFSAGGKLSLRWRGPRLIVKGLSDYIYQMENLHYFLTKAIHGSRIKFYHEFSLDKEANMSHVVSSEAGMPVQRLLHWEGTGRGLMVLVYWREISKSEDTLEPLKKVYEDVLQFVKKSMMRKNTLLAFASKTRRALGF